MQKQEKKRGDVPFTCTQEYDRSQCGECSCASCYLQEFCDRCKDCESRSLYRDRCNAYEGALTY